MCASYVYKRRRLQNSVAFLSAPKEAKLPYVLDCCHSNFGSTFCSPKPLEDQIKGGRELLNTSHAEDSLINLNHQLSAQIDVQIDGSSNQNFASIPAPVDTSYKLKEIKTSETSNLYYSVNDSCSSPRSLLEHYSVSGKAESEDMGECSSSDVIVLEPPSDFSSSRDLCLHVLKANGRGDHSSDSVTGAFVSSNVLCGEGADFFLPCKVCKQKENPRNMLICDLCDDAFHLHCCNEKAPFREEWYCQPCQSKNPRPLLDAALGISFRSISEEYKRRILLKELGPIQFMFRDTQPYTSGVRIGKAFQADVPEWSTTAIEDHDSFGEPLLLNTAECGYLNELNISKSSRLNSIGNWLQCREVIYNNTDKYGGGVVCGKWRRAPFFVTQTDNWDCSCCVLWDPIHADCAVPQELDTEDVLKQLKFIETLKARLDKKQDCQQAKSEDHRSMGRMQHLNHLLVSNPWK